MAPIERDKANGLLTAPCLESQDNLGQTLAGSLSSVSAPDDNQTVAYFDSTFEEAMTLTRETRDYLAYQKNGDLDKLNPVARLVASCESMRLTARLTQIVAWLLVQKAVHAGELTREEAREQRYRLSGREICEDTEPVGEAALPDGLLELLERSHQLYLRVARLDTMLDRRRD